MSSSIFIPDNWSLSTQAQDASLLNVEQRTELIEQIKTLFGTENVDFEALESKMIKVVEVPFSEIIIPTSDFDMSNPAGIEMSTANIEITHTIEFGKTSLTMCTKYEPFKDGFVIINDSSEYEIVVLKYPGI